MSVAVWIALAALTVDWQRRWDSDLDRGKLRQMTCEIGLSEVISVAPTILEGRVRGRIVVKIR